MYSIGYLYVCKRNDQPFWFDCGMTQQNPPEKRIRDKNQGLPPGEHFTVIAIKEIVVNEKPEDPKKLLRHFENEFFEKIEEFCERENEWFRPDDASPVRIVKILEESFNGTIDIRNLNYNYHNRPKGDDRRLKQKHIDTLENDAYVSFISGEKVYPSKRCWGKHSCGKVLPLWNFYLESYTDQDDPDFQPTLSKNYENLCMSCWNKKVEHNRKERSSDCQNQSFLLEA